MYPSKKSLSVATKNTPPAIADGPGPAYISSHTSTGTSAIRIRVSKLGAVSSMMRPRGPYPAFFCRALDALIRTFQSQEYGNPLWGAIKPVVGRAAACFVLNLTGRIWLAYGQT